jgi:hypothetical protein
MITVSKKQQLESIKNHYCPTKIETKAIQSCNNNKNKNKKQILKISFEKYKPNTDDEVAIDYMKKHIISTNISLFFPNTFPQYDPSLNDEKFNLSNLILKRISNEDIFFTNNDDNTSEEEKDLSEKYIFISKKYTKPSRSYYTNNINKFNNGYCLNCKSAISKNDIKTFYQIENECTIMCPRCFVDAIVDDRYLIHTLSYLDNCSYKGLPIKSINDLVNIWHIALFGND